MEKVRELINSVKEGKNGFSLNKPWRLEKTSFAVIPIIKKSDEEREYITFAEAQDVKVEDTGQIDFVYIKNNEDKPLLVCRGDIFKGKTQERASIHDYLIMPGKGNRVSVRCIHASKGIKSGADMEYGGRTANSINLSNQSKTWDSVKTTVSNYYTSNKSTGNISGSLHTTTTLPDINVNENSTLNNFNITSGISSAFHPTFDDNTFLNGGNITTNTLANIVTMALDQLNTQIIDKPLGTCGTSGASGGTVNVNENYTVGNSGVSGASGGPGTSGSSGSGGSGNSTLRNLFYSNATQTFNGTGSSVLTATTGNVLGWDVSNNGTSWTTHCSNNSTGYFTDSNVPKQDDYTTAFQDMRMKLKEIMQKVPYIKNQVGAILFKENDILGIDLFDHPDSWEQIKQDIIAKEGSSFMSNPEDDDLFVLNPKAFKKIVNKKLPDTFEEKTVYDKEYTVLELKSEFLMGEVLIYKDRVLHLTIWNKNN